MAKKSSLKKSLLVSALSLTLSASMLVGTTFAWFTDSVTNAGNKIQAGTLDIDLYDVTTGTEVEVTETSAPLFKYEKWEPGYKASKVLKVQNNGTLALKFRMDIMKTGSVGAADICDVIEVWATAPATSYDASNYEWQTDYTYCGTLNQMMAEGDGAIHGTLLEGESAYQGIVLKMSEEAGNEYQGAIAEFDIALRATQFTYESDSYDDQYDAGLDPTGSGVSVVCEDGSTVFYYNEESGFGGRVRLMGLPENLGNEYTVPEDVTDLGGALVGVSLDKLTVPTGVANAYKSLQGATIDEVVIEDGATTIPNRMFYQANVENIVIPSSVTTIEENAFAMAADVEELVIPASVTTVEEAAFQHMPALTTVTFEGNTAIQGYAFRGCANLRTVYLKGDDVTFITSTLNGRDSTWFCNGESNNPNTSNITFHVENETVAARVKTAMGAEAGNTPVYIGDVLYMTATNAGTLQQALDSATGNTLISVNADITGNVIVTQKANTKITVKGNDKAYKGSISIDGKSATILSAGLTIQNLHFDASNITTDACINMGIEGDDNTRYVTNLTVENCSFTGTYPTKEQVGIKTYTGGGQNLTVRNCTATNMHSLAQIHNIVNVEFEKCTVVDCKNGIAVGSSRNATITKCNITSTAYGIRGNGEETDSALTVTDCNIKAHIPVVIRKVSKGYKLTVNGTNTMTQTNTEDLWCVVATNEYGDVDKAGLTAVTATVSVTVNDTALNVSGVFVKE